MRSKAVFLYNNFLLSAGDLKGISELQRIHIIVSNVSSGMIIRIYVSALDNRLVIKHSVSTVKLQKGMANLNQC